MPAMKKLFAPLLLLLALIAAAGCTNYVVHSTAGLQTDLVSLQRTAGGEVRVTWRVRNPNVVAYVLTSVTHRISLDGAPVGTVTDGSRFGVPTANAVERTGVLVPNGPAAGEIIAQAIAKGSASYAVDSTLWMLVIDNKTEKFSLSSSGTIPATAE